MATSGQWAQWATSSRKPIRNAPLRLEPVTLAGSFFKIFLGFIVLCVLGCSRILILYLLLTLLFHSLSPCLRVSVVNIGFLVVARPRLCLRECVLYLLVRTRTYIPAP